MLKKSKPQSENFGAKFWCPGLDLNQQALRRYHLKVVSLPISPPGHFNQLGDYTPKHRQIQEKAVARLFVLVFFFLLGRCFCDFR